MKGWIENQIQQLVGYVESMNRFGHEYDNGFNILVIWMLVIGFAIFTLVKIVSYRAIQDEYDRTTVGYELKRQKLGEALMGFSLGSAYAMTLVEFHTGHERSLWGRVGVRLLVILGITLASWRGIRFVLALRQEK